MGDKFGKIEVNTEDLKRFQRAVRQSTDRELPKRLGQANKSIGQLVVDRLVPRPDPAAVGTGAGASVRPSASRREVLLRVGGKHREGRSPQMQWGKKPGGSPFSRRPQRPFIRETVERNRKDIEEAWIDATLAAMDGAFAKTEKR